MINNKTKLGLFLGFAGLCLGLVFLGVWLHTEPGLMSACLELPSHDAIYQTVDYPDTCKGKTSKPMVWAKDTKFPLSVLGISATPDQMESLKQTVKQANNELGFDAFDVTNNTDAVVVLFFNATESTSAQVDAHGGATTTHALDSDLNIVNSNTAFYNVVTASDLYLVMQHELGHALGLDHDDYGESIMTMPPTEEGVFSDSDKKLLKKLYAK